MSVKRSIYKTISYRILGSVSSFLIAYVATSDIEISIGVCLSDVVLKPFLYFVHERIWSKIEVF